MPLPLLAVPNYFYALSDIFELFGHQELLNMSLVSKNVNELTKKVKNKNWTFGISLSCAKIFSIEAVNEDESINNLMSVTEIEDSDPNEKLEYLILKGKSHPYKKGENGSLKVFWNTNRFDGLKALAEHACELFELPIHKLMVTDSNDLGFAKTCNDWIEKREQTLEICELTCIQPDHVELTYLLDSCECVEKLLLTGWPVGNFQHSFKPPINLEYIEVRDSKWPTVTNTFELNSLYLGIADGGFSSSDINRLVKNWLNGENPKLQRIWLGVSQFSMTDALDGIEVTRRKYSDKVLLSCTKELTLVIKHTFDIQRSDGTIASIIYDCPHSKIIQSDEEEDNEEKREDPKLFVMIVNPGIIGNQYVIEDSTHHKVVAPFALYSLPNDVLSDTIKQFDLQELLKLALVSKKSYKLIKEIERRKWTFNLQITWGDMVTIDSFNNGNRINLISITNVRYFDPNDKRNYITLNDELYLYEGDEDGSLNVFWDTNRLDGIKALAGYVCDIFDLPIHELYVTEGKMLGFGRACFDWIMSRQEKLASCKLTCDQADHSKLRTFLDSCDRVEELMLEGVPAEGFQYSFKHSMNLETVMIIDTTWPTVTNLFELNCRFLGMRDGGFSKSDINRFVKSWLNGGNSRLQCIWVGVDEFDITEALDGIDVIRREHPNGIEFDCLKNCVIESDETLDIQRADGTIASIIREPKEVKENNQFIMVVWPDWNGTRYVIEDVSYDEEVEPFPLYSLPYVALSGLFKQFGFQEILNLSFVSKESYNLAKLLNNKKWPYKIQLECGNILSLDVHNKKECIHLISMAEIGDCHPAEDLEYLTLNKKSYPYNQHKNGSLKVFWDTNRIQGIQSLAKYVCDLFVLPIYKLNVTGSGKLTDAKASIEWIESQQGKLESCKLAYNQPDHAELKALLDAFKCVEKLNLSGGPIEGFQHTFQSPMEQDFIEMWDDIKWATVANIFELNSRYLGIYRANFSNSDINRFMLNWLNGGNTRLQGIWLSVNQYNMPDALNGIETARREHRNDIEYFYSEEHSIKFNSTMEIRRADGTIASIICPYRVDEDEVEEFDEDEEEAGAQGGEDQEDDDEEPPLRYFIMMVWPDWNGKQYIAD